MRFEYDECIVTLGGQPHTTVLSSVDSRADEIGRLHISPRTFYECCYAECMEIFDSRQSSNRLHTAVADVLFAWLQLGY